MATEELEKFREKDQKRAEALDGVLLDFCSPWGCNKNMEGPRFGCFVLGGLGTSRRWLSSKGYKCLTRPPFLKSTWSAWGVFFFSQINPWHWDVFLVSLFIYVIMYICIYIYMYVNMQMFFCHRLVGQALMLVTLAEIKVNANQKEIRPGPRNQKTCLVPSDMLFFNMVYSSYLVVWCFGSCFRFVKGSCQEWVPNQVQLSHEGHLCSGADMACKNDQ